MTRYKQEAARLSREPRTWLVTGAAGFIGSHLTEHLLRLGQNVVALDNFATGSPRNVEDVRRAAGDGARRLRFVEGDINDLDTCREVCAGVDIVLHQAALGSVPRSIADPVRTNATNIGGFLNMLVAARDAGVSRLVYAASSSTYGDSPDLPKVEDRIGQPLSPYAVTKYANELYASVFRRTYGLPALGLRYFNVFGPRQDPDGAYAAVIPRWIRNLLAGERCLINGDGETTRDFTFVENVVQANILAATAPRIAEQAVFNVAAGARTSLNDLHAELRTLLARYRPEVADMVPSYADFRPGDVRHSLASIEKIGAEMAYEPTHTVQEGLALTVDWFVARYTASPQGLSSLEGAGR